MELTNEDMYKIIQSINRKREQAINDIRQRTLTLYNQAARTTQKFDQFRRREPFDGGLPGAAWSDSAHFSSIDAEPNIAPIDEQLEELSDGPLAQYTSEADGPANIKLNHPFSAGFPQTDFPSSS